MLLGLSKIIDCPGGVVPFETTLDLSQMDFGGCCPLHEPVHAKGSVRNTAGVLILTAEIDAVLDGVCDRCCKPFHRPFTALWKGIFAGSKGFQKKIQIF